MATANGNISGLRTDVDGLTSDMATANGNISGLRTDVDGLTSEMKTQVGNVRNYVDGVKQEAIDEVTGYIKEVKSGIQEETKQDIRSAMNRVAESGRPGGTYAGTDSYAAGKESKATGVNSIALGANSRAKDANEMNIGIWSKVPSETTPEQPVNRLFRSAPVVQEEYVQTGTRLLSGLSDGKKDDDAVTKKQLDEVDKTASERVARARKEAVTEANKYTDETTSAASKKVLGEANTYTDTESALMLQRAKIHTLNQSVQAENNAVARSNAYTDNRVSSLKQEVDRNEKRANGGIAGAMAMSAIPSVAGHDFSFGMALSGYRDQTAIAAGIKANITGDTSVSLNTAWDSGNGVGAAAGFAVGW
ncbi:hypothetical protein FAP59_19235 [Morganella morganii]|nr:hypothetical protein [Morganella morganii]